MTEANHDKHLIVRIKEDHDNVIPAAGSVATLNFLRLSGYGHRSDFKKAAEKTLKSIAPKIRQNPEAFTHMLIAMNVALANPLQIIIAGSADDNRTRDMLKKIRTLSIAGPIRSLTVYLVSSDADRARLKKYLSFVESIKPIDNKPAAYVCKDYACGQPITDPDMLLNLLKNGHPVK